MATRNRTILYRRYRDALKSVRVPAGSSPSSSGGGGGPVIELSTSSLLNPNRSYAPLSTEDPGTSSMGTVAVGLPPAWVDLSEEIAANIQLVRGKMTELAKAHAKALMPSFGDGKEDQRRIEALTQEITDLLRKSERRLQRLSAAGPSEDSNIRKNVQETVHIFETSSAAKRGSISFEVTISELPKAAILGPDGVDLEMNLNGNKSRRDEDDLNDMGFSEHQMAKLKKSEAFTAEREREIQQVVESVNELAQIMKDLSVLVIDQGTIVDRIDYNITNVAASVEDGLKQLQKADKSQKQGGMVMTLSQPSLSGGDDSTRAPMADPSSESRITNDVFLSSKYLKAAREVLDEVVSIGGRLKHQHNMGLPWYSCS
ncbi:syntaxin [Striga asiatica]|uniref:Syntaxin n=1 Tax=Striga asiatica TaxID=4170 RepID=A0A5A7QWL3_STRAF|nr:syntaxin [Striga asiatica]